MTKILGWDTETIEGKVILLMNSEGNYLYNDSEPIDFNEMLDFLFKYGMNNLNYWYNINYDWKSIMRNFNISLKDNVEKINFMKMSGNVQQFGKYFMFFADKTFFNLKKKANTHNAGTNFYDIMRFFPGGLDKNSKEYLGVGKESFDRTGIDKDRLQNDEQYLKDFIKYCLIDCVRTGQLTEYAINLYKELTDRPLMTPSSISERHLLNYLKKNDLFKNYFVPFSMYRPIMSTYYGGRFEDMYKGVFDKCYNYDINSAYPFVISELKQLTGTIDHAKEFNVDDIIFFYGLYSIKINKYNKFISPLIIRKMDGGVFNPNPDKPFFHICTYYDMLSLVEHGVKFEVLDVIRFRHNGKLLFPYFKDLYAKRLKLKREGNNQQQTYKIILNSTYGKMLYLKQYVQSTDNATNINYGGFFFQKIYYPGKIFNPLFASYITAKTRYDLLKACSNNNVISYATDGIYTTKKIKVELSDKLGDWEEQEYNNNIFVKSGIRKIGDKINARGYKQCKTEKDFIKLIKNGEWEQTELISTSHFQKWKDKVHTFQKVKKVITFNRDDKRIFPNVDSDDILSKSIKSKPYKYHNQSLPYKNHIVLLNQKNIKDL